jgi:hypothetical protein
MVLGCATPSTDGGASVVRAHDGSDVDDLRARPRQRGEVIGGERVRRTIAWPTVDGIDLAARDALGPATMAAIARAPLPVLRSAIAHAPLPVLVPAGHPDAKVMLGERWVAVSAHGIGYTIYVQGSGEARVYPHIRAVEPTHPVRAGDGFVTRNEGVWSFSWIEFGAAYTANVECDRRIVSWCDDEAAIAKIVDGLAVVGGKELTL